MTPIQIKYQVAAMDSAGRTSIWHVDAADENDARDMVREALFQETQEQPVVVLAVIPGGKK